MKWILKLKHGRRIYTYIIDAITKDHLGIWLRFDYHGKKQYLLYERGKIKSFNLIKE